jgi:hypothetical protein
MRRICALVLVLALVFPLAGAAGSAAQDPDGASAPAPSSAAATGDLGGPALPSWLDSVFRVLLGHFGV